MKHSIQCEYSINVNQFLNVLFFNVFYLFDCSIYSSFRCCKWANPKAYLKKHQGNAKCQNESNRTAEFVFPTSWFVSFESFILVLHALNVKIWDMCWKTFSIYLVVRAWNMKEYFCFSIAECNLNHDDGVLLLAIATAIVARLTLSNGLWISKCGFQLALFE